ncbi:hypothetical protein C4572_04230, partial [Candidatus Parcubacteria bacterium]
MKYKGKIFFIVFFSAFTYFAGEALGQFSGWVPQRSGQISVGDTSMSGNSAKITADPFASSFVEAAIRQYYRVSGTIYVYYDDADGDGHAGSEFISTSPLDYAVYPTDCDETDIDVYVGRSEDCDNKDNNCNYAIDEGCDNDKDGWCDSSLICIFNSTCQCHTAGDCDDEPILDPPGLCPADPVGCVRAPAGCAICVNPGVPEICTNGVDDNCNGIVDRGDVGCECTDGDNDGVCADDPRECDDENPLRYDGALEICDGIDNDCNLATPDGYDETGPGTTTCGIGACQRTGDLVCQNGVLTELCTPGTPTSDNNCDLIDQDCNGTPDDGYISVPCDGPNDTDLCQEGTSSCSGGTVTCSDSTPSTVDDNCDGVDDDCDGSADEHYSGGTCDGPDSDLCEEGAYTCLNGVQECSDMTGSTFDTDCDGNDEDCNGTPDDGYVSTPTSCGEADCVGTGSMICS